MALDDIRLRSAPALQAAGAMARAGRMVSVDLDPSKIGCSDFPTLMRVNKYSSWFNLYARLRYGTEQYFEEGLQETADFGHIFEEGIGYAFAVRQGLDPGRFIKPPTRYPAAKPWARYSLDFVAAQPPMLVECKLISERRFEAEAWGEPGTDQVPDRITAQVTAEMWFLNLEANYWGDTYGIDVAAIREAHVAVCVGGQHLKCFRVPYDPELGGMMVETAERFLRDYVIPGRLPPADGSEACTEELHRLYPGTTGVVRLATPEEATLAAELRGIKAQLGEVMPRKKEIENQIRAAIGGDLGIFGDGFSARWTPKKDEGRALYVRFDKEVGA